MNKKIRLRVHVKAKFSRGLQDELDRLSAFVDDPALAQRLLRAAVAETLLAAYRKRFLARFADALNMQSARNTKSTPDATKAVKRARRRLEELSVELAGQQLAGEDTTKLERRIKKAEERLVDAYDKDFGQSELATGMFRPLALQVLALLTQVGNTHVNSTDTRTQVGVGHIPTLDAIKTPSATRMLTGRETSSRMNKLWRHLEFGTGIHSQPKKGRAWWYGTKTRGLKLFGSKGVHALYNTQGVPYEADAMRFETHFAKLLERALRGK